MAQRRLQKVIDEQRAVVIMKLIAYNVHTYLLAQPHGDWWRGHDAVHISKPALTGFHGMGARVSLSSCNHWQHMGASPTDTLPRIGSTGNAAALVARATRPTAVRL